MASNANAIDVDMQPPPPFPQARMLMSMPQYEPLLGRLIDVIEGSGALRETQANNSMEPGNNRGWMQAYKGFVDSTYGIARGYAPPIKPDETKPASRMKEKFVKDWGPAAKRQVDNDDKADKESSKNVLNLATLYLAYVEFVEADKAEKRAAKEKAERTKQLMDAYEKDAGAQPPGAKGRKDSATSNLSFSAASSATPRANRNVPNPPGAGPGSGIPGGPDNPGGNKNAMNEIISAFHPLLKGEGDDAGAVLGDEEREKKRQKLVAKVNRLKEKKEVAKEDFMTYKEMDDVDNLATAKKEYKESADELKKTHLEIESLYRQDASAQSSIVTPQVPRGAPPPN